MGVVTGLTADRMLAIEAASVVDGAVDLSGHLILTKHDSTTIDAGNVVGPAGADGSNGTNGTDATAPTGAIMMFPVATPPTGWLLCDGSAVSRTAYAALFALLGTTYGTGDGSSTFNLPNTKGRVPVGRDSGQTEFDTLGETGGAKTHTLAATEMPAHNHGGTTGAMSANASHSHTQQLGGSISTVANAAGLYVIGNANNAAVSSTNTDHNHSIPSAGGGGAHNNLQPYLVLNYIIKT